MIQSFTLFTAEIDDAGVAVPEILAQLDEKDALLKNSIGLLHCYSDFIESGVVKALSEALPFDILGATTLGTATQGSEELAELTILVLTSDDVEFVTGLSAPISEEDAGIIADACAQAASAAGQTGEKPALMINYAPLLMNVGGDFFVKAATAATGGAPVFGTLAIDDNLDYHDSQVLYKGDAYKDRLAFLLLFGEVTPKFYLASISKEKVLRDKGVVTGASGNQLREINDVSVSDYLTSIGLTKDEDGAISGINAHPFVVDYNDGTVPVVRIMFAITPEGYAVCGGDIPVGATLLVGSIDGDDVVRATAERLDEILAGEKPNALLIFSCVGRYFSLGYNTSREADEVSSMLDGTGIPYTLSYSAGELCPAQSTEGNADLTNRFHNDTFIVCAL
ncbi:MAG: FIST C-terminal domain-containing protein [Clostridiales Family XIII bacterium]|jgi:hypothetical protein|nr:FIST C-terminal domain-containing protein [Clostridiales Family XIII bacterium]